MQLTRNERSAAVRWSAIKAHLFAYNAVGLLILPDIGGIVQQLLAAICAGEINIKHCAEIRKILTKTMIVSNRFITIIGGNDILCKYTTTTRQELAKYHCARIRDRSLIFYTDNYNQQILPFYDHNNLYIKLAAKYTHLIEQNYEYTTKITIIL